MKIMIKNLNKELLDDLRSDHAGEVGAVWIYKGILTVSKDPKVRDFAMRHINTEREHLNKINSVFPKVEQSKLVPIWKIAGFLTGALPSLVNSKSVYATIEAVETFVDKHYQEQIEKLKDKPDNSDLLNILKECQEDECEHRDEAASQYDDSSNSIPLNIWCMLVGKGSSLAVKMAKII